MTRNEFHQAMYLAKTLYEVEFTDEDDFDEIALIGYGLIGNKEVKLKRFIGKIDQVTLSLELPCDCDIIEAVTHAYGEWSNPDGVWPNGDFSTAWTEAYIESRKHERDPLATWGGRVPYWRVGNVLYFDHNHGPICVLYKSQEKDGEGLPYLNDKEALAVATYVAYVQKHKESLKTHNNAIMQEAQMLKKDWERYCDQARTPEELTQNDAQMIINTKNSWDRGFHNFSYKPQR